jgi:hypothetical protein
MPAQPNDLAQARSEAALLLRLDPTNLSPSDVLRCDLIASLRLVVDDASASVLDGRGPDLSRLIVATETLIRLLPQTTSEPADREGGPNDPRQIMWKTYLEARRRGALVGEGYDGLKLTVERLQAELAAFKSENEQLRAQLAGSVPLPPNVVPMRHATSEPSARAAAAPQPPKPTPPTPPSDEERARALAIANAPVPEHIRDTRPKGEAWRDHMSSAHYDRWANRNW